MAVRIPRKNISESQAEQIRKLLTLQPKENTFFTSQFNTPPKCPVLFYLLEGEDVLLPYIFYAKFFSQVSNIDRIYPLKPFSFIGTLFEHQVPVEEEAAAQINQKGSTTLGLYPGFGKPVVGAKLASRLGLPTAVIYHRKLLGPQWATTFKEFTDATVWIVGEESAPSVMPQVTICMDTQVEKLTSTYRSQVGVLIIDEAHAFCTPSRVNSLLRWEPRYVIAETATLIRSDGMHSMIQALCGMHGIFQISTKPFEVVKLLTGFEPEVKQTLQGRLDYDALLKSLAFSDYRNRLALKVIKNNPDKKILILTRLKEHVQILSKMLQAEEESVDTFSGNKQTYSDSRILVGTISKIGTGFDEKTLCPNFGGQRINVVILMSSIKDLALLEQNVGRAFRAENPIVVDFVDDNSTLQNHSKERDKWYISRNGRIMEHRMIPPDQNKIKTYYTFDGKQIAVSTKLNDETQNKIPLPRLK